MSFNRFKTKQYIRILTFVLAFFVIASLLSYTVFAPSSVTALDESLTSKYSYVNEPDQSLQIVGVGNSDLSSGFIPNLLWERLGYTSNIISAPRQTPKQSYQKLNKILLKQSPELVIIETDMLYEDGAQGEGVNAQGKLNRFFEYIDPKAFDISVEDNLTVFKFHNVWKKFSSDDKTGNVSMFTHGYKYSPLVNGVSLSGFMKKSEGVDPIGETDALYMKKLVDICRENNIDVFFLEILSPYSWTYPRHNAVQELADRLGVDFIDTNLLIEDVGFDPSRDFRDIGNHLNYNGAVRLTSYICDYIESRYSYEDRREKAEYSYWQTSCEEFKKRVK